jgi:dihydroorotase
LSKFLALGLSLPEVIERATSKPAAAIRQNHLGTLKPGSAADIALFSLEEGDFTFQDIFMSGRKHNERLVNTLTIIDGREMERVPLPKLQPWAVLSRKQRENLIPLVEVPCKDPAPLLDNRKV